MEKKKKSKEIFTLIMGCLMCCVVLCIAGCGGKSCQKPSCQSANGITVVSLPGCGGCLTSGWGCNTGCWSQAYGCMGIRDGCDGCGFVAANNYYGSKSCIGCGEKAKSDMAMFVVGCDGVACVGSVGDCNACGIGYNKHTGCDVETMVGSDII